MDCVSAQYYFDDQQNVLIDGVKQHVFEAMNQLEGWCSKHKAMVLIELIFNLHPKKVVEIGVFGGKSLIPMAYALKVLGEGKIYGIDPWDSAESILGLEGEHYLWWSELDHENILSGLEEKILEFDLKEQVELIRKSSKEAKAISRIDLLHIDGNHSDGASYFDVTKWVPLVRKGGVIVFNDINYETTGRAVEWLDANCIRIANFQEGSEWGIWIKK